jgi:large subunit ribosomal protein L37Ae
LDAKTRIELKKKLKIIFVVKMKKKATSGSAKRFGVRYGARNREKVAAIEVLYQGRQKCPFCNYVKVKRLSKGIWACEKCKAKFTGKAYTFDAAKKRTDVMAKDEEVEEPEEEDYAEEPEAEPEQADESEEETTEEGA